MRISSSRTIWRSNDGAAAVILALSLTALTGAAAVGVDLGSIFLAKRQLQGIADSAALAAAATDIANDGMAAAQSVVDQSRLADIEIRQLTPGQYIRDAAIDPAARFSETATQPSAAKLSLERQVPLFFGRLLLGKSTLSVEAQATAARRDMAAFSIGTSLATLSGGLPNQILSALAGTSLNLSVMDGQRLAAADIDLLNFADALRLRLNERGKSYTDIFDTSIPIQKLVLAMADAAPDDATGNILNSIASRLGSNSATLSDIIDLGPLGQTDVNDGNSQIKVDAFSFLRSLLALQQGDIFEAQLNTTVPGLSSVKLTLVGNNGTEHSPWMTITDARNVVIRTSRSRLYLETSFLSALSGIASLRVPVFIELAEAEARLADIKCGGNAMTDGVTLAVTPSVGSVAISDVTTAQLHDFSATPGTQPAVLANILLGTKVSANANIRLGGTQPQNVHFTKSDIANHVIRSVSTNDAFDGIASSLMHDVEISVTILGITTKVGPVVNAVGAQLGLVAPVLDGLINQLTGLLGVKLGSADVQVDRMRCGIPVLVA